MDKFSGEDLLLGLYAIQKKAAEAPWALREHELPKGNWKRVINPDGEAFCNIVTKNYVIGIKTGRVIFLDKNTKKRLPPIMGFHHLNSGDVKPDESELVVLDCEKHFYVISLKTFEVIKKALVPRGTYTGSVYCTFSADGKILYVPVQLYDYDIRQYKYFMCEYETENYTLLKKTEIKREEVDWWTDEKKD